MKKLLYSLSGILAFVFLFLAHSTPVSAIVQKVQVESVQFTFSNGAKQLKDVWGNSGTSTPVFFPSGAMGVSAIQINFNPISVKSGQLMNLEFSMVGTATNEGGVEINNIPISLNISMQSQCPVSSNSNFAVTDCNFDLTPITPGNRYPNSLSSASSVYLYDRILYFYTYHITGYFNSSTTYSNLAFDWRIFNETNVVSSPTYSSNDDYSLTVIRPFIQLYDDLTSKQQTDAINQNTESVDNQTQQQKEQFDKEQQQREEDEKKANDSGDKSQSDADDAQAGVDESSASLFSVVTSIKDSIMQGSDRGNCTISANFGFFDAGTIDICTGGSKIKPIISIVGDVMLVFFTFGSALTLLNTFIKLYDEAFR